MGIEKTGSVMVGTVGMGMVVVMVCEHGSKWITAAERIIAEGIPSAEECSEEIEGIHGSVVVLAGVGTTRTTVPTPASLLESILTKSIVSCAFLLITEYFVRLSDFFELFLGIRFFIFIRMKLERHFPIGLLYILLSCSSL